MKRKRKFDTNYFHNPHVQGVNYSLFIMVLKEMMSVESNGESRAAPVASPLLSSQSSDHFCVVRGSAPHRSKIVEGGI
jgi:hypothetical protein